MACRASEVLDCLAEAASYNNRFRVQARVAVIQLPLMASVQQPASAVASPVLQSTSCSQNIDGPACAADTGSLKLNKQTLYDPNL